MQKNNNIEDLFIEDSLQKVSIHQSEQDNLDRVFDSLYNLENEPSSDENSVNKMYIKKIKQNAELKRKTNFNKLYNKTNKSIINEKNNFNDILSHSKCNTNLNTLNNTNSTNHKKFIKKDFADDFNNYSEDKQKHKKFGQKALRKILKQYLPKDYEISKEDIRLMIWENDENLDGYLNKNEFDKMYKRCVSDEKEQEAKRLFYLVLFLMFDKDNKKYIVEEDTLEILYIRYKADFEKVLRSIFGYLIMMYIN